jgi:hypothetical protein
VNKEEKQMDEKIELSKNDNDQMELRKALIMDKQREMQKLQLEAQIITREYQSYISELYKKHKLDEKKQYTIKNGFITEIVEDDKQTKPKE